MESCSLLNFKITLAIIAAISVAGSIGIFFTMMLTHSLPGSPYMVPPIVFEKPVSILSESSQDLKKFTSYEELKKFLQESQISEPWA